MSFVFVFVYQKYKIRQVIVEREYCRLKEENASLKFEIMAIQLEEKKYRNLQLEVDQLSAQLRKVSAFY